MGSIIKLTDDAMFKICHHNNRETIENSNVDIVEERSELNYSFTLNHGDLTDYEYYKKRVGELYLYGRGSLREKEAVTGFNMVVTAPKEICGDQEKEDAFFKGVFDFVSNRYGVENIVNTAVHYDEVGQGPHIHLVIIPVTKLDHDVVQNKTVKTTNAVKLESGRYEYSYRFKHDENGERIPLKNYAKMSDYYDEKIDANSVLNKAELRHFHQDLQQYLTDNGIEGKVITGKTGGVNFTVQELKEFTANTGLRLEDVQELTADKGILEALVSSNDKVQTLEQIIKEKNLTIANLQTEIQSRDRAIDRADKTAELAEKDKQIRDLTKIISAKNQALSQATDKTTEFEKKLNEMQQTLTEKERALASANERIKELETKKNVEVKPTEQPQSWGQEPTSSWGSTARSGWGTNTVNNEEEKLW